MQMLREHTLLAFPSFLYYQNESPARARYLTFLGIMIETTIHKTFIGLAEPERTRSSEKIIISSAQNAQLYFLI